MGPSENGSPDQSPDELQVAEQPFGILSDESQNEGIEAGITSDYIAPEESALVIPKNVSGRNGYQQMQDEQEQIGDADAEQLRNQLDTGYTGDGLEILLLRFTTRISCWGKGGKGIQRPVLAQKD